MQYPRHLVSQRIWKRASSAAMSADPDSDAARQFRLACLQEAKLPGQTQTAFAAKVGLDVKRWNNYLRGWPLPQDAALILIKAVPGITYDWLWHGRLDGVPLTLQAELEEAGKRIMSAPISRSRRV